MNPTRKRAARESFPFLLIARFAGLFVGFGTASAQSPLVLWQDQFDGRSASSQWTIFSDERFDGRTEWGGKPEFRREGATSFARLRVASYNASHPGTNFKGTALSSLDPVVLGSGIEVEARLRGSPQRGAQFAFFLAGAKGIPPDSCQDEIDFEFFGNSPHNEVSVSTWNDWNPFAYRSRDGFHHQNLEPEVTGLNWTQWNTYKIRWLNGRTEWYINNVLIYSDATVLPDDPMYINFLVKAAGARVDPSFTPTSNPLASVSSFVDVDYIRISSIPAATNAVSGKGQGVAVTYYENPNLTGRAVSQVDPRIHFDWRNWAPVGSLGTDHFSARWTGQIQAQFSENYRFYARANGGVRLWINNILLIDHWTGSGLSESVASIALLAGVKYNLQMEYHANTGGAQAELLWSCSSIRRELVPQCQLYPSTGGNRAQSITANIVSPASGDTVPFNSTIHVLATAAYGLRKVELFADGIKVDEQTIAQSTDLYSFALSMPLGSHVFSARATDVLGASAASTAVSVSAASAVSLQVRVANPVGNMASVPANLTLQATASDLVATVGKVDYYDGSRRLGTATTAPYQLSWLSIPEGIHTLTARATSLLNRTVTSTPKLVSIGKPETPIISVTTPGNRTNFNAGALIPLYCSATSRGGTVTSAEFLADGVRHGAGTSAPFSYGYSLPVGSHTLSVRATDNFGGVTVSSPLAITVGGNKPPTVRLISPLQDTGLPAGTTCLYASADDGDGNGTVDKVDFYSDGALIGSGNRYPTWTNNWIFKWDAPPPGAHRVTAKATDNLGAVATSTTPLDIITGWRQQDIGGEGVAGRFLCYNGNYIVSGSGAIFPSATHDDFRYAFMPWTGDGEIVARITGVENTDFDAKAGVMFRESLATNARNVMMALRPVSVLSFYSRTTTGSTTSYQGGASVQTPYWVKLVRKGNILSGFRSADGLHWTLTGTEAMNFPLSCYVGLAVTSGVNGISCKATFDQVTISK